MILRKQKKPFCNHSISISVGLITDRQADRQTEQQYLILKYLSHLGPPLRHMGKIQSWPCVLGAKPFSGKTILYMADFFDRFASSCLLLQINKPFPFVETKAVIPFSNQIWSECTRWNRTHHLKIYINERNPLGQRHSSCSQCKMTDLCLWGKASPAGKLAYTPRHEWHPSIGMIFFHLMRE